ncbi:hypothetical protein PGT21_010138 [Puccinia graminis f. sp. tritici]|uniref:Uncharacterized protein n=1 Tax=Puccinia graminis f. sp. tritici TaxID=56615 RepID=A0A5B0PCE3_PUCGR|nr:hypothetical protein PGT21_010138 [Puccinia graminis f. sp. tritici]
MVPPAPAGGASLRSLGKRGTLPSSTVDSSSPGDLITSQLQSNLVGPIRNFAKKAELSKNQLEDKLNAGLAHRPEAEKLVQEGIVTKEETAEPIQQLQDTDHTK